MLRAPPRTTNRQHRPHSGLSLTHSTPGDRTLVRPPGHWLRLVISHALSERRQSHGTRPSDRTKRQSQMNAGGVRFAATNKIVFVRPYQCRRKTANLKDKTREVTDSIPGRTPEFRGCNYPVTFMALQEGEKNARGGKWRRIEGRRPHTKQPHKT